MGAGTYVVDCNNDFSFPMLGKIMSTSLKKIAKFAKKWAFNYLGKGISIDIQNSDLYYLYQVLSNKIIQFRILILKHRHRDLIVRYGSLLFQLWTFKVD